MALHTGFKTFENKHIYNNDAYRQFITDLNQEDAVWTEFLPTPLPCTTESVLIRTKLLGSDEWDTFKVPNSRLYMLKNEIRYGFQYGFAYTDFFNAMKTIYHTKQWFPAESNFKVYGVKMEHQDFLRVIDYTYRTKEEQQMFLQQILIVASLFGHTNKLMARWETTVSKKPSKQKVMKRFNDYSKTFLILNNVNPATYQEGEGKTPYHFFNTIEQADSFSDLKRRLSVYNLGFEQMTNNFLAFYETFYHNAQNTKPKVINSIARNVYFG